MPQPMRFRHFLDALRADFKQSRTWRAVRALYAIATLGWFVLWFVTTWSPASITAQWSRATVVAIGLGLACVGLVILLVKVVDGTGRILREKTSKLEKAHKEQAESLEQRIASLERKVLGQQDIHASEIKEMETLHKGEMEVYGDRFRREREKERIQRERLEENYGMLKAAYDKLKDDKSA